MKHVMMAMLMTLLGAVSLQAQLEAPDPPALNHVHRRVNVLEKQIADHIALLRGADEYTRRAIQAEINYRILARRLFQLGLDAGPVDGAVAIVYAHTLADHADDASAMFQRLPKMAAVATNPDGGLDENQKLAVSKFAAAVAAFNSIVSDEDNELDDASAQRVQAHLRKMLSPVVTMASIMGEPSPVNTWLRQSRDDQADGLAPPVISPTDLELMTERIHAAKVSSKTKTELLLMVQLLRRGWSAPDLRPRVAHLYDLLDQALVVAEAMTGASWVDDETMADFREQLHTAILLVKDPRTRASGVARFASLAESLDVIEQLDALEQQAAAIDTLRDLFVISHTMRIEQRDLDTARALIDYLQRMTGVMLAYRDRLGDELPLDLRKVSLAVRKDYQQQELKLLSDLRALAANPAEVTDPKWTDPLDELAASQATVRRVHLIPNWTERLQRFKPRPTHGLFRTLRDLALRLTDPELREDGARALHLFERQVVLFDPMPLETAMRNGEPAIERVTNGAHLLLVDQMDRLRSDWASAWASGQDPAEPARKLMMLRTLLGHVDTARRIVNVDQAAAKLNKWAGWQVDGEAIEPLMQVLPDRIAQACRDAAIGNWESLDQALEQIERESTLPMLVAQLSGKLHGGLDELPGDLTGLLSQCVYQPTADAIAIDQQQTLAQVCVYLAEAAHARQVGDSRQLSAALGRVGELAGQVLKAWSTP